MVIITPTKENLELILRSSEIYTAIEKIGTEFGLHIDQIGALDAETRSVMIGTKNKEDFLSDISDNLEISKEMAGEIITKINENIFLKIRELLKSDSGKPSIHLETPDEILKHIEDGGLELPAPEVAPIPEPEVKPDLTEHLLQNTVASPHVEETKVEKKYTVDPYREPIA
jgi:hypothetical protein